MKNIAVDLGGTLIKIGIVEKDKILISSIIDADSGKGLKPGLQKVVEEINSLLTKLNLDLKSISGIGISIPGIIDSDNMKMLSVKEKYSDAVEINFKEWAKDNLNLPVFIENDARSALAGEWQFGAGKGIDNLVMLTLGTGIGGAALIKGSLIRGKHFQAGCLGGHFTINFHGDKCNCGNVGCAEAEASSWSLPNFVKQDNDFDSSLLSQFQVIDYKNLFFAAGQRDKVAEKYVKHSLLAWSSAVINLIHAYDPEAVILGGGVMRSANIILPFIKEEVSKRAWTPWGKVQIFKAEDMDNAALLGINFLLQVYLKS